MIHCLPPGFITFTHDYGLLHKGNQILSTLSVLVSRTGDFHVTISQLNGHIFTYTRCPLITTTLYTNLYLRRNTNQPFLTWKNLISISRQSPYAMTHPESLTSAIPDTAHLVPKNQADWVCDNNICLNYINILISRWKFTRNKTEIYNRTRSPDNV